MIESPKRVVRHSMVAAKRIQREGVSRATVVEDVAHYLRFGLDHPRVASNDTAALTAAARQLIAPVVERVCALDAAGLAQLTEHIAGSVRQSRIVEAGSRAFAEIPARALTDERAARDERAPASDARPSALLRALWVAVQDDGSPREALRWVCDVLCDEFALARPTPTRAPAEMRDLAIADLELTAGAPAPGPPADDGPATHQPDDAAASRRVTFVPAAARSRTHTVAEPSSGSGGARLNHTLGVLERDGGGGGSDSEGELADAAVRPSSGPPFVKPRYARAAVLGAQRKERSRSPTNLLEHVDVPGPEWLSQMPRQPFDRFVEAAARGELVRLRAMLDGDAAAFALVPPGHAADYKPPGSELTVEEIARAAQAAQRLPVSPMAAAARRTDLQPDASAAVIGGVPPPADLVREAHTTMRCTALHAACEFGHRAVVSLLIDAGARVNSQECAEGRSPLIVCALNSRERIAYDLMARRCDKTLIDEHGLRASQQVANPGAKPSLDLLRETLKDAPSRVAAITLQQAQPYALSIRWTEAVASGEQAVTDDYHVTYAMTHARVINSAYVRLKAMLAPLPPQRAGVDAKTVVAAAEREAAGDLRAERFEEPRVRALTLRLDDLVPATAYAIRVKARNAAGYGPISPEATLQTTADVPTRPGTPYVMHTTPTSISVGWLPPAFVNGSPLLSYEFQRFAIKGTGVEMNSGSRQRPTRGGGGGGAGSPAKAQGGGGGGDDDDGGGVRGFTLRRPVGQVLRPPGEDSDDPETWTIPNLGWVKFQVKPETQHFNVAGLVPFSACIFRVRARNEIGWSEFSALGGPHVGEESIRVRKLAARRLVVEFTPLTTRAYRWELQRKMERGPAYDDQFETVSDEIEHAERVGVPVTGLRPGTAYRFRVRANDIYGWRSWDTALNTPIVRTRELPPDAPRAPVDVLDLCTAISITVRWEAGFCNGPPVEECEVSIIEDGGAASSMLQVSRIRRKLSGLAVDGDDARGGSKSSKSSDDDDDDDDEDDSDDDDDEEEDEEEEEQEEAKPKLSRWGSVKKAVGTWRWAASVSGNESAATVDGLVAAETYLFRVRCRNVHGWSAWSPTSKPIRTNIIVPPGRPRLRGAGITWFEVAWAPPTDSSGHETMVDKYELQMRLSGTREWSDAARGAGGGDNGDDGASSTGRLASVSASVQKAAQHALRQPFYLVSDLKPLHQYYFRVRALTVNGWSAFTPESDPMTCSRRY